MLGSLIQEAHGAYLARGGWWTEIPPEFRMLFALANFIFNLIVISGFLYMAGRLVVGGKRATYTSDLAGADKEFLRNRMARRHRRGCARRDSVSHNITNPCSRVPNHRNRARTMANFALAFDAMEMNHY